YALAKRTLDLVCAAVLLVALLPVFALVGLAIVLESRGPVFYCAERIGRFGRPFCVAKFRSMRADADPEAHAAFIGSLLREEARCAVYKVPDDPRITRVGAFLRRTSLDELPQLWNVLRGEMSLVGPRPDVPYAVAQYPDWVGPRRGDGCHDGRSARRQISLHGVPHRRGRRAVRPLRRGVHVAGTRARARGRRRAGPPRLRHAGFVLTRRAPGGRASPERRAARPAPPC